MAKDRSRKAAPRKRTASASRRPSSHVQDAALIKFLTENVPDYAVILLDLDGRILTWNAGAELIKGYAAREIIGQNFARFYPPEDIASGRPQKLLDLARRNGRHEETGRRVRKDGSIFWANVVIVPRFDSRKRHIGYGKLTRDVTAQVEAAATERRLHQFVDVIRETMIDGLIVIDSSGIIRVFNPAAEQIFGYSASEVVGENLRMLMPMPVRGRHDGYLRRYGETGIRSVIGTAREVTAQRKDGTTLPVSIAVGEAKFDDETIFVGVVHDLTRQKAVEGDLRQAQRLDAIGKLTGGIAHDFNNILMVIMSNVEALLEGRATEPVLQRRLGRISQAAERAAELTGRLLAFARKQPLKPQPVDVNEVVLQTSRLLERTLGEHVELETNLDGALWIVGVDRTQLESALVNLCINARDAMPEGGRLVIETRNAVVGPTDESTVPPGAYVILAVRDNGLGIAADVIEHVFEPFFTTKGAGKGTGLGLSMVYGFMKQSDGHVTIRSEVGRGTEVRLYLPRDQGSAVASALRPQTAVEGGSERILVVEDDDHVREGVVAQLESLGYAPTEAGSGAEGLDRLKAGEPFDLLLTDVVMPGAINGHALAKAAAEVAPELRIVFMSGYTEDTMVHQGRLDPGVRLLRKPFHKEDLARMVRGALDEADGNPGLSSESPGSGPSA
ncbi:PAS domain S-box protein [Reyranella sp.]|uniref:hybrid sensor histidine kinase/response regulator n=1 Tax=Reyranella sp. TaxID=1929291 RepID=UPI003BA87E7B